MRPVLLVLPLALLLSSCGSQSDLEPLARNPDAFESVKFVEVSGAGEGTAYARTRGGRLWFIKNGIAVPVQELKNAVPAPP